MFLGPGYHGCHSGGFGLIQWTTTGRYNGLGRFAAKYGGDPNQLNTQLRYMVNENQWVSNEHVWKTPGLSINQHMNAAYRWLGWGIHGNRTTYAYQYFDALTQVEVEVPAERSRIPRSLRVALFAQAVLQLLPVLSRCC